MNRLCNFGLVALEESTFTIFFYNTDVFTENIYIPEHLTKI